MRLLKIQMKILYEIRTYRRNADSMLRNNVKSMRLICVTVVCKSIIVSFLIIFFFFIIKKDFFGVLVGLRVFDNEMISW